MFLSDYSPIYNPYHETFYLGKRTFSEYSAINQETEENEANNQTKHSNQNGYNETGFNEEIKNYSVPIMSDPNKKSSNQGL